MTDYEVVIIGAGPVGTALAIELGLQNIKTALIEKYSHPQMLPKAQLINPRSMEFFRRWGASQDLISKKLLPPDFPLASTWCSGLSGKIYSSINAAENISTDQSPENYQRIPLWITEEILRNRLKDFPSVDFIKNSEVTTVIQNNDSVMTTFNHGKIATLQSKYVVGCDGANSITRQMTAIEMQTELSPLKMINVLFNSQELKEKMTIPKGILYYNLTLKKPAAMGCVDYENGLWYASLTAPEEESLNNINVSELLNEFAGFDFQKDIKQTGFWFRQAQIATQFQDKRIFLAGDAAHTLPPTGGHGLNTGLGDATNLGWKLAAVLREQASPTLLESYDLERRPIALRNILASKINAQDAAKIREKFPLESEEFAKENIRIAKQHAVSPGIALGYYYQNSPIISTDSDYIYQDTPANYQSIARPGFFAPHLSMNNDQCLYDHLESKYHLLITDDAYPTKAAPLINLFQQMDIPLKIIQLPNNHLYQKKYYLIRPDWHISWSDEIIPPHLTELINQLLSYEK